MNEYVYLPSKDTTTSSKLITPFVRLFISGDYLFLSAGNVVLNRLSERVPSQFDRMFFLCMYLLIFQ